MCAVLSHMRKDDSAKKDVRSLEDRFLSPSSILESNIQTLPAQELRAAEAQILSLIPDITRYALRTNFGPRPKLSSLQSASEYLKTLYIGVTIEQFYVLCLDSSGKMIRCHRLQSGTVDETPFYIGNLLQTVVRSRASAIVLSHNHPGGTLCASRADVDCTLAAIAALIPVGITLLDHVIIADDTAISIRDEGFIPNHIWIDQNPSSKLNAKWML